MHLPQGENLSLSPLLFFLFNWFTSVTFTFFFLTTFTLLFLSFLLFLSYLVTSRLVTGWELQWGAPGGHFLLSKTARLGKGKTLLSETMGKIPILDITGLVMICHAAAVSRQQYSHYVQAALL